jgi:hypothetical protein
MNQHRRSIVQSAIALLSTYAFGSLAAPAVIAASEGTVSWRKIGEQAHAAQDLIVCSRSEWRRLVMEDPSRSKWATVIFAFGVVAVSPSRFIDSPAT